MKQRYTEPEWTRITISAQDVIACSGATSGNLSYAEDDKDDKENNKVSW